LLIAEIRSPKFSSRFFRWLFAIFWCLLYCHVGTTQCRTGIN